MQFSALTAIFKADFGRFRPVPAVFRPISAISAVSAVSAPILAESARFGANRSRFGTNRAASARIEPSRRESVKKKKTQTRSDARATASNAASRVAPRPASRRVGRGCGTPGAASVLSRSSLVIQIPQFCSIAPPSLTGFFWQIPNTSQTPKNSLHFEYVWVGFGYKSPFKI